jgi:hypothetical protein
MWFQEPASVGTPYSLDILSPISETAVRAAVQESKFTIYSQGDINQFLFYHGTPPVSASVFEQHFDQIYDNPYIQILVNLRYGQG